MCLSKKIKCSKGNEKCAPPALMLVTWDTGVGVHESAIVVMANMANTGKLYKWYGDRVERGESCKPRLNPRPEKWFFPDPRFPPKSPKMGEGQFFPPLPQKMPILFHSGNKRQFKLCPKSVSNHQDQLVEAEKLFKKSHIFAWFHCSTHLSGSLLLFLFNFILTQAPHVSYPPV